MLLALAAAAEDGGILKSLGINFWVVGIQVVIFSITFLVLSRLLFGRALGFMQRREEEVRASREAIARDRADVARLLKEYEARMAQVDKQAYDRSQAMVKEGVASSQALMAKAAADAQADVRQGLAEVEAWKTEVRPRVREGIARFAIQSVEKALDAPLDHRILEPAAKAFLEGRI